MPPSPHTNGRQRPRWIGFDMDECIGSVMPLFHFVEEAPSARVKEILVAHILASELRGETWLLRPALLQLLSALWVAYLEKQITGCFILSNNGSEALIEFVCELLNAYIEHAMRLAARPRVFVFGAGLYHPCREDAGTAVSAVAAAPKDLRTIARLLDAHGFHAMPLRKDILFYDDARHVLQTEIPNYMQVRPYLHYTPYTRLRAVLRPLRDMYGVKWESICAASRRDQHADIKDHGVYELEPQRAIESLRDYDILYSALAQFLAAANAD